MQKQTSIHSWSAGNITDSIPTRRFWWPYCLMCGFAAARLLGLRVRIPVRAWMSVSCVCCVMSGRGLCDELIILPEEYY
jgi:hypothetical protein